jgi:hypothetical protein
MTIISSIIIWWAPQLQPASINPVFDIIRQYYTTRTTQNEAERSKLLNMVNVAQKNANKLFNTQELNQLTAYQRQLEIEIGIVDTQKAITNFTKAVNQIKKLATDNGQLKNTLYIFEFFIKEPHYRIAANDLKKLSALVSTVYKKIETLYTMRTKQTLGHLRLINTILNAAENLAYFTSPQLAQLKKYSLQAEAEYDAEWRAQDLVNKTLKIMENGGNVASKAIRLAGIFRTPTYDKVTRPYLKGKIAYTDNDPAPACPDWIWVY